MWYFSLYFLIYCSVYLAIQLPGCKYVIIKLSWVEFCVWKLQTGNATDCHLISGMLYMYCNPCLARAHRIGSRANIVDLGGNVYTPLRCVATRDYFATAEYFVDAIMAAKYSGLKRSRKLVISGHSYRWLTSDYRVGGKFIITNLLLRLMRSFW